MLEKVHSKIKSTINKAREQEFEKLGSAMIAWVNELVQGELKIPETKIARPVEEALAKINGLSGVKFTCCNGFFRLEANAKKWGCQYGLDARIALERLFMNKQEQVAVLRVLDDAIRLTPRNLLARLFKGIAQRTLTRTVTAPATATAAHESTKGLVQLAWPCITLDLSRVEQIRRVNDWKVLGEGMLDFVEVCRGSVCEGKLVAVGRVTCGRQHKNKEQ